MNCLNCNKPVSDKAKYCSDKCRMAYTRRTKEGEQPEQIEPEQPTRTFEGMTPVDKLFEESKPGYYKFAELKKEKCHLGEMNDKLCSKEFETHLSLLRFCSPNHQKAAVYILGGQAEQAKALL